MKIAILNIQVPFVLGGAEMHADNLRAKLIEHGHQAELINIPFKWYPTKTIMENMMACRLIDITETCGEKIDLAIGLRFPAYLIPHPNKVMWILHQHRAAYDLWDTPLSYMKDFPDGPEVRDAIEAADRALIPEAKAIFANSANVSHRLKHYCDIDSTPLYHPPPHAESFYCEPAEPFLFYPSRLNATKRQELLIDALAHTSQPVVLYIAGTGSEPGYEESLKQRAEDKGVASRIRWLGFISEEQKREYYAKCLGVVFPPIDEDYGYITLEAMLSSKPVITLTDSGGPLEFVVDGETGYISEPDAAALGATLDQCWANPETMKTLGQNGREHYHGKRISWDHVIDCLTRNY